MGNRINGSRVGVEFGKDDLGTLLRWCRSRLTNVRCAVRANMVSMASTGFTDRVIAQDLDAGAPRVRRWVVRYVNLGHHGLEKDAHHGGCPREVSAQRGIELTTQTRAEAATPPERAHSGQTSRCQCGHGLAYLALARPQAPFEQDLQSLH